MLLHNRYLALAVASSLCISTFCGYGVAAKDKNVTVEVDGKALTFDVNPQIVNGRTLVPLRKIFEELGANVKWDDDTQTVFARKSSKTISLTIDSNELKISKGKTDADGNEVIDVVELDVPAQIVSDRTLVPTRAVSEAFGLNVDWDDESQTVTITSPTEDDDSWKANVGKVNLTDLSVEGSGIAVEGTQVIITEGGDYTVVGSIEEGSIKISSRDKVKLRLSGMSITTSDGPCIFAEDADKLYITLEAETDNYLNAENSKDGAIYSKENLEFKGKGTLNIKSSNGHGIKASDNLSIENGTININATSDGIHVNDTFKMSDGDLNIESIGDGIDSESIVNITGGKLNIQTNATPIQPEQTEPEATQNDNRRAPFESRVDVEFENSSKGISAEWMLCILGGEIYVDSASHTVHCKDEIQIDNASLTLTSKYGKGISAHGNLTISGSETFIDVTKSTEGLESKNILTVNDGNIKVVASDDAVNATGGNSGNRMGGPQNFDRGENGEKRPPQERFGNGENQPPAWDREGGFEGGNRPPQNGEFAPPNGDKPVWGNAPQWGDTPPQMRGEFMGGGRPNLKTCLIINGGNFELCGTNDCLDSNGSTIINGGTIKANDINGTFTGAFAIVDQDGSVTISEDVNFVFAANGGNVQSLNLKQNTITIYLENAHEANDKITVLNSNGDVVYDYTPLGGYKAVLIASKNIVIGNEYTITVGDEAFTVTPTEQNTIIGTPSTGGMGFGGGRFGR